MALIDPFDVRPGDRITIVGMRGEANLPATVVRLGDASHPLPAAWIKCDDRDHETFVALWRKDLVLPLGSGMVEVTRLQRKAAA